MLRVLVRTGVLRTVAGAERGEGVICTVIDRSIPRDLVGLFSCEFLVIPAAGI